LKVVDLHWLPAKPRPGWTLGRSTKKHDWCTHKGKNGGISFALSSQIVLFPQVSRFSVHSVGWAKGKICKMAFNIKTARESFPALNQPQVFFDNAGGSQTLGTVINE
jgi:hypothetical protein